MNHASQHRSLLLSNKTVKISCIVPAYNEELTLADFLTQLQSQLANLSQEFEILVIDDGSTDRTTEIAEAAAQQSPFVRLVRFSRNFGKEYAIEAGLRHCSGQVGIIIDADFEHPLELIPIFLEKWAEGFDMVYGLREDRDTQSNVRRFFSNLFYKLLKKLTSIKIPANAGDFRLIDRVAIDSLNNCQEKTRFMKGLYAWIGYSSVAIPFKVTYKPARKSKHHYRRLTELAVTGLISFSDVPLRVWGLIGLSVSFLSFCVALYIIIDTLVNGATVPGYASLMVTIVFFGGIQLLSIGIVGEYIARIFHEVKKRPSYVIEKTVGLNSDDS